MSSGADGWYAVDAVSRGVILTFERAQLETRWQSQPPLERIVVESVGNWRNASLAEIVSASGRWPVFLGLRLNS